MDDKKEGVAMSPGSSVFGLICLLSGTVGSLEARIVSCAGLKLLSSRRQDSNCRLSLIKSASSFAGPLTQSYRFVPFHGLGRLLGSQCFSPLGSGFTSRCRHQRGSAAFDGDNHTMPTRPPKMTRASKVLMKRRLLSHSVCHLWRTRAWWRQPVLLYLNSVWPAAPRSFQQRE